MKRNCSDDVYSYRSVRKELDKLGFQNVELRFFNETDSTNTGIKNAYLCGELEGAALFVSRIQTAGRGRRGRSFVSPDAGVYMSMLIPSSLTASDAATLTAYAAVMTADAIEELTGVSPEIKWVNDIYSSSYKLAGILCEGIINAESGKLSASVVGIGINVLKTDFPKELSGIASSVEEVTGLEISRTELASLLCSKIMKNLHLLSSGELIERYRKKLNVLGKRVKVLRGEESYFARALDINERAELIVEKENGELYTLNSGEVSIALNSNK